MSKHAPVSLETLGIGVLDGGRGWVALDKPCGVSVHNDPGRDLVSAVIHTLATEPARLLQEEGTRSDSVHAVHRLDGDTSGVVLFAFGKEAARHLTRQFEEKQVTKEYLALVHGDLTPEKGRWAQPLAKEAGGRTNPAGSGKRMASITAFSVVSRSVHYTLVRCSPLTGRKHQIRRHAKLSGHPLTGDRRYGSKRALAVLEERFGYRRLGLHARTITFCPPGSDQTITVASADSVPEAMETLLQGDMAQE
ncbi:RluA family pseudouridine synthase [Desulfoluna butyratoxydans]|uniref:Pseudouridine synthase rsua/rlub/c/d/e/f n=1 Tax=Desulfoluna butyratoxydans TaxID=231438 RepID=A0A4U8YQJ4_9BACT|nr:RluA family pseudouridine synthase [Desulfoluna butyratoxydans]VFQ45529.1 pseudouridine synthase rsua/rlub/c/d/e/f [Desulfoluna butyratoxydans]